jgi:hypothetical protein
MGVESRTSGVLASTSASAMSSVSRNRSIAGLVSLVIVGLFLAFEGQRGGLVTEWRRARAREAVSPRTSGTQGY